MKTTISFLAALALLTGAVALGRTVTGSIPVAAKIVTGNSVQAYLVAGEVITSVHNNASGASTAPHGAAPLVRINFENNPYFVDHVTWDKANHKLTIDF